MQKNKNLFGLEEPAKVAVAHGMVSRRLDFMSVNGDLHNGGAPDRQLISVVDMLLNLNVPFHMLVSGEGMQGIQHTIDKDLLSQYEVVILPNVMAFSDLEMETLVQYVRDGGKVIQINDFATLNVEGKKVNRRDITSFTQKNGSHILGQGLWLRENWGNFEFRYLYGEGTHLLPTEQSKDNQHLQRLKKLNDNVPLDMEVKAPLTVNVRRFVDEDRIVLHIVNYDYDQVKDEFTSSGPIEITLGKQGVSINTTKLFDLETTDKSKISFEDIGEEIRIRIPDVHVYSIVELR
jgi:hypothetical protein